MISSGCTSSIAVCFSLPSGSSKVTVLGCRPINFFIANDVLPFAFSSNNFPSRINAITTDAASKYTCASRPLACQNFGNNILNTLNKYAMPVLNATRVSILAERCLACFHALIKKSLPSQRTTGVANTHMISLA